LSTETSSENDLVKKGAKPDEQLPNALSTPAGVTATPGSQLSTETSSENDLVKKGAKPDEQLPNAFSTQAGVMATPSGQLSPTLATGAGVTDITTTREQPPTPSPDRGFNVITYILILILLLLIGIILALLLYRWFVCKINAISLDTPLPQLPRQHELLKRAHCLTQVLAKNQVPEKYWNDAIAFAQKMLPAAQAEILAKRLGAKRWEPKETALFTVYLPANFPLNLPLFLLYFPAADGEATDILNQLRQYKDIHEQKVVIITLAELQQEALHPYGENTSNLWVIPNHRELTNWLLSKEPVLVFTRILAEQLELTQISPYQTRGGVNNDTMFFGRTKILDIMLHRKPANYIIVGGRQIGKSSLLKYIHRHYQNHPQVQCHYLSLHGDNPQGQLAVTLGLPSQVNFDTILNRLAEIAPSQRQLFLLDEADLFILAEMKNGYPFLNRLCKITEVGYCHFILAGFWDLYQTFKLDKRSTLRDFAELITIAELGATACRDLAVKPMQTMNLHYTQPELVNKLLVKTGQRAHLIATICNEMLKELGKGKCVLGDEEIVQAFNSDAVLTVLTEWQSGGELLNDEPASHLDRIIVYATIEKGEFNLIELPQKLTKLGCTYTTTQIKQSLERLIFNYVIKSTASGQYVYCVPLFREMLLKEDVNDLLQWEL
jgi:hypothetical protein